MQLTFKEKVPFLKEKNNEWKEYLMSDVFKRVIRKNKESNNNVLTISAKFGLINQRKFFNKNIASETLTGYYLLQKGEFAYNKSYSKNYSYGAIKRLDKYNKGVVSTLYICFGLIDDKLFSSDFFIHFFESGALNKGLYRITQEGARNHGLLNMAVKDFFNLPILIPHIEEQKEIARFFNMLDREIEIIEEQKKLLAIEKKGIKQNLFSGLSNWITKSELKIEEK